MQIQVRSQFHLGEFDHGVDAGARQAGLRVSEAADFLGTGSKEKINIMSKPVSS